jgi:hypothetical protein
VTRAKVRARDLPECIVRCAFGELPEQRLRPRGSVLARPRHQVFLRFEVAVKTAVGKPGRLHQVRDADAPETALAEELRSRIQNAFARPNSLLSGYPIRSGPIPG